MLTLTHILCPTDFSTVSTAAEGYAAALAARYEARLTLLHIDPPVPIMAPYGEIPVDVRLFEEQRAQAERDLAAARDRARTAGATVEATLVGGYPGREILAAASDEDADLIVLGSHGRGGVEGAVPGDGRAGDGDAARRGALRAYPLPGRRLGRVGRGHRVRRVTGP
jgi:nucleotide-binding universal stress UspA family protein